MTTEKKPSVSVFFPAHNEVENIGPLTEKTVDVLKKMGVDYEVLIIDDGSKDGTGPEADRLAEKFEKVRAIHHPVNKGYGGAVWTGIHTASKDLIFFTDGDGQFDTTELSDFYQALDGHDAVFGYRIERQDPFHRKVFARCWGMLIRLLFGIKLRDLDCAFKLFKRKFVEGLEPQCGGAMVSVELVTKMKARGLDYIEKGAHHYPRVAGEQSGGSLKVILRAFKELFLSYWKLRNFSG